LTFVVQGQEYEGRGLGFVFQIERNHTQKYLHAQIKKFLAEGKKIYVEIEKGARAGTIGELVLPENFDDLYANVGTNQNARDRRQNRDTWLLKFDDSDKTVKLEGTYRKHVMEKVSFVQQPTVWKYTSVARPKEELPVLHDHFGVELAVGQVVLALIGTGTDQYVRLGKITRWSAKGTIWIETMKTRETHPKNAEATVQGSINIFVLDGDIRAKAMMAKMTYT
jgi:hypothetical protein